MGNISQGKKFLFKAKEDVKALKIKEDTEPLNNLWNPAECVCVCVYSHGSAGADSWLGNIAEDIDMVGKLS